MSAKILPILAIVILGVILIFAASDDDHKNSANYVLVPFEEIDIICLGSPLEGIVVRNQDEYQSLIDTSPDLHPNPGLFCIDYQFPKIDFSQKTLLGYAVSGGGCSHTIERRAWRSELNKEVIYDIRADFVGSCDKRISEDNLILVPQIPEDYKVSFRVDSE